MLIWILVAALAILYFLFVIQPQNMPVTPTMVNMMSPSVTRMMATTAASK